MRDSLKTRKCLFEYVLKKYMSNKKITKEHRAQVLWYLTDLINEIMTNTVENEHASYIEYDKYSSKVIRTKEDKALEAALIVVIDRSQVVEEYIEALKFADELLSKARYKDLKKLKQLRRIFL